MCCVCCSLSGASICKSTACRCQQSLHCKSQHALQIAATSSGTLVAATSVPLLVLFLTHAFLCSTPIAYMRADQNCLLLTVYCHAQSPGTTLAHNLLPVLQEFYEANKEKPLILLKWLAVQAGCCMPGNVKNVRALMDHPAFHITTPNCCYSLFLGFARSVNFHAADGSGYEFVGDAVIKVSACCQSYELLL